jgi:hypothetical protein
MGEHAEGGVMEKLVGKRVQTRWPDDNSFYEAIITDYSAHDVFTTLEYLVICFPPICR